MIRTVVGWVVFTATAAFGLALAASGNWGLSVAFAAVGAAVGVVAGFGVVLR